MCLVDCAVMIDEEMFIVNLPNSNRITSPSFADAVVDFNVDDVDDDGDRWGIFPAEATVDNRLNITSTNTDFIL